MLPASFRSASIDSLPSPDELRNKVLLKGTMLSVTGEQEDDESDTEDDEESSAGRKLTKSTSNSENVDYANMQLVNNLSFLVEDKNKKRERCEKTLSDITHFRSVHFHGYDKAKGEI